MSLLSTELTDYNGIENNEEDGGILALAQAVAGDETDQLGAAEELLALASEASLSSPINREEPSTPPCPILPSERTTQTRGHSCTNCGVTSTPFWRKSPNGLYYCNACGLYLRTHNTMRPASLSKNRESRRGKIRPEACGNCAATETPMWRKTEDGLMVCNACGLYHKLHGQHRKVGSKYQQRNVNNRVKHDDREAIVTNNSGNTVSTGNNANIVNTGNIVSTGNTGTFTIENPESSSSTNSATVGTGNTFKTSPTSAKYSLDPQFHHKFDPNNSTKRTAEINTPFTSSSSSIKSSSSPPPNQHHNHHILPPIAHVQPIDVRKMAYMKGLHGHPAPIAPKINVNINTANDIVNYSQSTSPLLQQYSSPTIPQPTSSTSPSMPPVLFNFINSLASTSPDNFASFDQVDHPLQPLLTSIVSQKLKEQRSKASKKPPQMSDDNLTQFINSQQEALFYNNANTKFPQDHQPEDFQIPSHLLQHHPQNQQHYGQYGFQQANHDFHHFDGNPNPQQQQHSNYFPHHLQYHPHTQHTHNHHHQQQQHNYHIPNQHQHEQFHRQSNSNYSHNPAPQSDVANSPPLRQLSPFSGLKFDNSLIELVNMQFWQDNQENSTDSTNY
jgi:hypothetical protein